MRGEEEEEEEKRVKKGMDFCTLVWNAIICKDSWTLVWIGMDFYGFLWILVLFHF